MTVDFHAPSLCSPSRQRVYALHLEIAEAKAALKISVKTLPRLYERLKLPDGECSDLPVVQTGQHRANWPLDYFPVVGVAADADFAVVS